jgi:hypothetical protein
MISGYQKVTLEQAYKLYIKSLTYELVNYDNDSQLDIYVSRTSKQWVIEVNNKVKMG